MKVLILGLETVGNAPIDVGHHAPLMGKKSFTS